MKKKYIRLFIVLLIIISGFLIFLYISSHRTERHITLVDNCEAIISDINIPSENLNLLRYAGGKIVYSIVQDNNGKLEEVLYYIKDSNTTSISKNFYSIDREGNEILTFCGNENKGINALILKLVQGEENICIESIHWDGTRKNIISMNDFRRSEDDNFYNWKMQELTDGNILIYSTFAYRIVDIKGTLLKEGTFSEPGIYEIDCFPEDTCFFTRYDYGTRQISLISQTGETKLENLPVNSNNYQMLGETNNSILIRTDWKLYRYNPASFELETIWNWSDFGIKGDKLWQIYQTDTGELGGLIYDNNKVQCIIWSRRPSLAKEQIILGCLGDDSNAYRAAAIYNSEQNDCLVKVKNYDSQDPTASLNLMYREILTGKGPDIIAVDPDNMDYLSMGEKGLLEDLSPYLADSNYISGGDLIPSLYEALQENGKMFMLPTNFSISVMSTKQVFLDDMDSWTISGIQKLLANNSDFNIGIDKYQMLDLCFEYDMYGELFDRKKAFDEAKFASYLEFANRMPEVPNYMSNEDLYKNNKVPFEPTGIYEVNDYLYQKKLWGDGFTCVGFPGASRDLVIIMPKFCWGINAQSSNKDAAWKFIENFYIHDYKNLPSWPFPTLKKLFSEQLAEGATKLLNTDVDGTITEYPRISYEYNGELIEIYSATQEDLDEINSLVDNAAMIHRNHKEAQNIIHEEAESYFSGQKTAREVSKIIGRRITNYIEEIQ